VRFPGPSRSRSVLATIIIVVVVTGLFTAAYAFHWFGFGTNCWNRPSNVPAKSAYFVVVAADEGMNVGFNGSKFQSGHWPIMNVTLGQSVWIHVVNNDTVAAHAFAIATYFNTGLKLSPGQCGDAVFTANRLGSFLVYCFIECPIHNVMQNGVVNVNP
jgi:hypothetical protein